MCEKVHCNASFTKGDTFEAIGIVARNFKGDDILSIATERVCGLQVDHLELLAVQKGLEIAMEEGWQCVRFLKTDYNKVSGWLDRWELHH